MEMDHGTFNGFHLLIGRRMRLRAPCKSLD
jgi:hypothetical protein